MSFTIENVWMQSHFLVTPGSLNKGQHLKVWSYWVWQDQGLIWHTKHYQSLFSVFWQATRGKMFWRNVHVTVRKPKNIKQFMAKKTMAKYKTMFSLQGKSSVKPIFSLQSP